MTRRADTRMGGSGMPKERPRVEDPVAQYRRDLLEVAAGHVASLELLSLRDSLHFATLTEVQAAQIAHEAAPANQEATVVVQAEAITRDAAALPEQAGRVMTRVGLDLAS